MGETTALSKSHIFRVCYMINAALVLCIVFVCMFTSPWLTRDIAGDFYQIGLWKHCLGDVCQNLGSGKEYFENSYAITWSVMFVAYGTVVFLLGFAVLTGLPGFCISSKNTDYFPFALILISLIILFILPIIFPIGWGEDFISDACLNGGAYDLGVCNIGWSYI
eukprot:Awhi_evm1s494